MVCRALLVGALLVYCTLLIGMSIAKHTSYHSSLIDLGIFDQVIWNTAHGRWFWDTLDPYVQLHHLFLAQHFSPGLAVLAPLYWVAPNVETLLVVQTLALAVGAVPVYLLARRRLADERIAALLAIAYLALPSLAYANLFDFHEIVMAVPLLAFAVERLDAQRPLAGVLLLLASMIFKEEVGLIVAGFGLFVYFAQHRRALGAVLALGGVTWTALVVYVVIPRLRGGPYLFAGRYQGGLLVHGRLDFAYLLHFLNAEKAGFLALLLLPLLCLPLLSGWGMALIVPTIGYTLLSTFPNQYDYHYHYAAPLLPLLFATSVYGLERLPIRQRLPLAAAVLALVVGTGWLLGPLPGQREFITSNYQMGPRERAMAHLVALAPPGVPLAVDNQMGAHLTERVWVTHFFTGYQQADALLFDLRERSATEQKRLRAIAAITHDPAWHLVAEDDDIVLYVRR